MSPKFCYPAQAGKQARVSETPRDGVEAGAECGEGQRPEMLMTKPHEKQNARPDTEGHGHDSAAEARA